LKNYNVRITEIARRNSLSPDLKKNAFELYYINVDGKLVHIDLKEIKMDSQNGEEVVI
jgi:alkyl hydroperoxide reductase subunit AhpC